jgi:hypothetical protein
MRERLPMPAHLAKSFPSLLVQHQDLLGEALAHDLRGDLRAGDGRRPDPRTVLGSDHQHAIERHGRADLAFDLLDAQEVAFPNAVLLSSCHDDSVHLQLLRASCPPPMGALRVGCAQKRVKAAKRRS